MKCGTDNLWKRQNQLIIKQVPPLSTSRHVIRTWNHERPHTGAPRTQLQQWFDTAHSPEWLKRNKQWNERTHRRIQTISRSRWVFESLSRIFTRWKTNFLTEIVEKCKISRNCEKFSRKAQTGHAQFPKEFSLFSLPRWFNNLRLIEGIESDGDSLHCPKVHESDLLGQGSDDAARPRKSSAKLDWHRKLTQNQQNFALKNDRIQRQVTLAAKTRTIFVCVSTFFFDGRFHHFKKKNLAGLN